MKPWLSYIRSHPLLAVAFTAILTTLATASAFRDDWLWPIACAYAVLTGLLCFLVWRHSCVVCICLGFVVSPSGWAQELPPPTQEPEVAEAGPVLGGVVVVAGGVMCYLLWKFCQKRFPKTRPPSPPTNNPANPTNTLPNTASVHALGLDIDLGSCPQDWQEPEYTTSHVTVSVGPGGGLETSVQSGMGPDYIQSFQSLQDQARAYGLEIMGHCQPPASTVDGTAGESDMLSWLPEIRTVRVQRDGETLYGVLLEVSQDLRGWQPLARVECGEGFRVTFSDTEEGSPWFYRVTSTLGD